MHQTCTGNFAAGICLSQPAGNKKFEKNAGPLLAFRCFCKELCNQVCLTGDGMREDLQTADSASVARVVALLERLSILDSELQSEPTLPNAACSFREAWEPWRDWVAELRTCAPPILAAREDGSCVPCEPGYAGAFALASGTFACEPCPAGLYCPGLGGSPTICPAGAYPRKYFFGIYCFVVDFFDIFGSMSEQLGNL